MFVGPRARRSYCCARTQGMKNMKTFNEIFIDKTKCGVKVRTSEYKERGRSIIVDQGQTQIAGYTDRADGLFEEVPVIIFGDHTRVIKYIDRPFFLGADGVKVLRSKDDDANYKYLYYALKNAHIPNTGYNRHFKWLKEVQIEYPDSNKQAKIVSILDTIEDIIQERKDELNRLDNLIKARFVELFGDPNAPRVLENKHKIGELCEVTKLAGFEFTEYIKYQDSGEIIMLRGLNCKQGKLVLDNVKYIDRETSHKLPRSRLYTGDILMTYVGTIGDVAMVDEDDKYHLAPNVAKISINDKEKLSPVFLVHLFMYSYDYIMTFASKVVQASINMQKIREFEYNIPPMKQQNKFEQFVYQVEKSKLPLIKKYTLQNI